MAKKTTQTGFTGELKKLGFSARNDGDICTVTFVFRADNPAAVKLVPMYGEVCKVSVELDDGTPPLDGVGDEPEQEVG